MAYGNPDSTAVGLQLPRLLGEALHFDELQVEDSLHQFWRDYHSLVRGDGHWIAHIRYPGTIVGRGVVGRGWVGCRGDGWLLLLTGQGR